LYTNEQMGRHANTKVDFSDRKRERGRERETEKKKRKWELDTMGVAEQCNQKSKNGTSVSALHFEPFHFSFAHEL
jgi:ribosomal protein S8E